jgi:hypothetical protein
VAAKSELGRDSRKGKIPSVTTKYLVRVKQRVEEEPVRQCWAWGLREKLDMIGLGCVWQNARETEIRPTCHVIKVSDIQGQRWLAEMTEKRLSLYGDLKHSW